ncbi:MAG: glutamate-5-semialdehyde dehydrogenase [Planctomycetota bacterium]
MNPATGETPIQAAARAARAASHAVAILPAETKDAVLRGLADRIAANAGEILAANAEDVAAARAAGVATPKLRRLELSDESLAQVSEGLRQIAAMPDPVGAVTRSWRTADGLEVEKRRTPLGVIAMIYEARPAVTIDAFALCFKAGNACLLKGGREAARSNAALAGLARASLEAHACPADAITAITTSDRDEIKRLLAMDDCIDLVIPRGGKTLIRFVAENSSIPTVQHYHGVCHIYVDRAADLERALDVVVTAKVSAPATCNALECVLVHEAVAPAFVPELAESCADAGIEIRASERLRAHAPAADLVAASVEDFGHEFLDLVLAADTTPSIDAAIEHIRRHGSSHTDAILTEDAGAAERFAREVSSSCVLVNASTRFNDGFSLGLGAEIGISTQRVHAFGPMGLEQLTIERFVARGEHHTR